MNTRIIFKSRKSTFFIVIVAGVVIGLTAVCIFQLFTKNDPVLMIPLQLICWLCIIFLLWIYLQTNYRLEDGILLYRSGPINGKIALDKIEEIIIGDKNFVGLKPATGSNGLVVKYNRWDEIYISPDSNEKFIEAVLKINNNIKITDLRK